jgi:hypothetical protein
MPLGEETFDDIRKSTFRVETHWSGGGGSSATAFTVATFRDSKKLVLATAAHVLDCPENDTVHWKIQQFDERGDVARQLQFATDKGMLGGVPYHTHKELDIGVFVLPATNDKKETFARPDEEPLRVIDILSGASAGTRVAWAGFASSVEEFLQAPHLCYFEGVISVMAHGQRLIYVVDGHLSPGVSGGPVWHWSSEKSRFEVIGIAVGYGHTQGSPLPGFCVVEPINPIMYYLETDIWHPDKCGDHLITNRRG